ncbi:MAG: response regulator [Candidatus Zixiibacteriota bacterium]
MTDSPERQTIIIVDDEDMVLTSLSSFLSLETDYNIVTNTSAPKALDYIRENGCDLVISDYLMPEMDGVTFLGKVKEIVPAVPRIILTGFADKENAIKAINVVGLYQYIEKPWNNDDLLIIIRNAIERYHLINELKAKTSQANIASSELDDMHKAILKLFV